MATEPAKLEPHRGKTLPYEAPLPLLPFLLKPLIAVVLLLLLWWLWPVWQADLGLQPPHNLQKPLQGLPWLLLLAGITALTIRLAEAYAQFHLGHRPPRLVRQIIALVALLVGAGTAVATMWDVPVGSLMTTSGLLVAVVGIALKNMISDLVNGLSMPVKVGDWIEVAGMKGQVVEISWRATKLSGSDRITLTIPNTHFITHPIRNYGADGGYYVDSVKLVLPVTVTAYQAERILVGAAHQIAAIAALPKNPEARILSFTDSGVEWELRFPVPDGGSAAQMRHRVQRILLRDLYYSGIELPVAQIEVHRPPHSEDRPQREEVIFLSHIDLFGTMTHDELDLVCNRMRPRLLRAGAAVVNQGDAGDSLFIVQEGLLPASIETEAGSSQVGKIRPGQFFGEMSLLTGAARSATVTPLVDSKVFEVDREILAPILQDRPEIAALMSRVLAERQLANSRQENAVQMREARDSLSQQILGHITAFFRLPARARYSSA